MGYVGLERGKKWRGERLVNLHLTANGSDFPGRRPEHFASRRHHTQLCQLEEKFHISHSLPSSDLE